MALGVRESVICFKIGTKCRFVSTDISIKMADNGVVASCPDVKKRRKNGEKSVNCARKKLKDAGKEYISSVNKVIPARKPPNNEVNANLNFQVIF
jgi:hypothetical protein